MWRQGAPAYAGSFQQARTTFRVLDRYAVGCCQIVGSCEPPRAACILSSPSYWSSSAELSISALLRRRHSLSAGIATIKHT